MKNNKRKMEDEEIEQQFPVYQEEGMPRIVSFDPEQLFQEKPTCDPTQLSSVSFGLEIDFKGNASFDAHSLMDPSLYIASSQGEYDPFQKSMPFMQFTPNGPESFSDFKPVDPTVVPATSSSPCEAMKIADVDKNLDHRHNLRPKGSPKFRFSHVFDSDASTTNDQDDEDYKDDPFDLKKSDQDSSTTPRKKRAYYRKNQHSKEFLAKVEEERLQKKRVKNRELAAKSRQKKKQKMSELEAKVENLTQELEQARHELRCLKQNCTCQQL